MFLIGAVVIAVVLGYVLGGKITNLSGMCLRSLWAGYPHQIARSHFKLPTQNIRNSVKGLLANEDR